jgi:hypothetical protein
MCLFILLFATAAQKRTRRAGPVAAKDSRQYSRRPFYSDKKIRIIKFSLPYSLLQNSAAIPIFYSAPTYHISRGTTEEKKNRTNYYWRVSQKTRFNIDSF